MTFYDPTYLETLRDLPTSYLLDVLSDNEEIDRDTLFQVLQERGMSRDHVEQRVKARLKSEWSRPYRLWAVARWLTISTSVFASFTIGMWM